MTSCSCISNHDEILIFPDKALVWMRVIPIASPQYNHYDRQYQTRPAILINLNCLLLSCKYIYCAVLMVLVGGSKEQFLFADYFLGPASSQI